MVGSRPTDACSRMYVDDLCTTLAFIQMVIQALINVGNRM